MARPLRLPALREKLAERILEETDVLRMIALENMPRNKSLLLTLYSGGFRVAEACGLKWSDLQSRDKAGQITVFGKGSKTRTVLVPQSVWSSLMSLRGDSPESDYRRRGMDLLRRDRRSVFEPRRDGVSDMAIQGHSSSGRRRARHGRNEL